MTFGEFALREYAYRRQEQWEWAKYRLVGFMAIRAFNIDPKNIPKRVSDVIKLPLVDGNNNIEDKQIEAFKEAYRKYEEQVKKKNG